MDDRNGTEPSSLAAALNYSSYSAVAAAAFSSIDYELFQQALNVSNRTVEQNYSFPWQQSAEEEEYWDGGSAYPSGYSHWGIILTSFFVTVIMILIVVGNMLVCIAIATEKALKTVQNWFIASLAVSDFLVGLVIMPFSLAKEVMGYWIFGRVWCEVHSALDVFLCTASINSLCLISLDRYWSVTQAVEYLRKRTPRRAFLMICGVWVMSAVISLPPLVGWRKPEKPSHYPECLLSDDVGYVLYSAFGSFYVPAFVMVFVYCRIFVAARSRARRHLKKKQKACVATELTCDPIKDKSTTTTTCTSFSNASPPEKGPSKDFPAELLPKIPESNGTKSSEVVSQVSPPAVVFIEAPEIVIENSDEDLCKEDGQDDLQRVTFKEDLPLETSNSLCKSSSSNIDRNSPEVLQRVTFTEDEANSLCKSSASNFDRNSPEGLQRLTSKEEDVPSNTEKNSPEILQRVTFKEEDVSSNSLCSSNIDNKKDNNVVAPSSDKKHLFVKEPSQGPRRTSLLRAPKFLRSPFGSTLSLADIGGSEEDVSEMGDESKPSSKKKKKKKKANKAMVEEAAPKRQPTTEAERHKRRIAKAKERRATLILGLIMASFILAWLPFFVLYVLEALCKVCDIGPTAFAVAFWLGYCNSALNPIIYTIFNRDFRRAFRKILFK